jgi:site-specific DNA recombinase
VTGSAKQTTKGLTERQVRDSLRRFDELWSELFPAEQARLVQLLVERIDISEKGADITLRIEGLTTILKDLHDRAQQRSAA